MQAFLGTKVALLCGQNLLMIQRDDKPGLRFAGLWDFPGGGREDHETPEECATREIKEELNLTFSPEDFTYKRQWPSMHDPATVAWFLVLPITQDSVRRVKLGDEGQAWRLVDVNDFMHGQDVVPDLKSRFQDYLDHLQGIKTSIE